MAVAVLDQVDSGDVELMGEVFEQIHQSSPVNGKSLYLLATRVPSEHHERRDLGTLYVYL